MSLMNDALLDLDKRSRESKADSVSQNINSENKYIARFTIFLIGFLLFVAIVNTPFMINRVKHENNYPAPVISDVVSPSPAPVTESSAIKVNDAKLVKIEDKEDVQAPIEYWLEQGKLAVKDRRLSVPQSNSALYYYSKILDVDPSNKNALDGMRVLKNAYHTVIEEAWEQGEFEKAKRYALRFRSLLDLDELGDYQSLFSRFDEQIRVVERDSGDKKDSIPEKPKASMEIYQSSQQELERQVALVESAIESGDFDKALRLSRDSENDFSDSYALKELHLKALLGASEYSGIRALLDQPEYRDAHYYRAKTIQYYDGDLASIIFLESLSAIDEASLALLAGLQQKHRRYKSAIENYKTLAAQSPSNTMYRLGLAVCLDASGNSVQARNAYLKIRLNQSLSEDLRNFVSQRISALAAVGPERELSQW